MTLPQGTSHQGTHSSPGPAVVDEAFDPGGPLRSRRKAEAASARDGCDHNRARRRSARPRCVAVGEADHDVGARAFGLHSAKTETHVGATSSDQFRVTGTAYLFDSVHGRIDRIDHHLHTGHAQRHERAINLPEGARQEVVLDAVGGVDADRQGISDPGPDCSQARDLVWVLASSPGERSGRQECLEMLPWYAVPLGQMHRRAGVPRNRSEAGEVRASTTPSNSRALADPPFAGARRHERRSLSVRQEANSRPECHHHRKSPDPRRHPANHRARDPLKL